MKNRIFLIPLVLLLSSCSNRPTAAEHAAAIQILDREKEKLDELTAKYEQAKAERYQLNRDVYIGETKEYVCDQDTVDHTLRTIDSMKSTLSSLSADESARLRKTLVDRLDKVQSGHALWEARGREFDALAEDKKSAVYKNLQKDYRKLKAYDPWVEQQKRYQAAKKRLDEIEAQL